MNACRKYCVLYGSIVLSSVVLTFVSSIESIGNCKFKGAPKDFCSELTELLTLK